LRTQGKNKQALLLSVLISVASFGAFAADGIFEYKVIEFKKENAKTSPEVEALLNRLGAEGWELVELSPMGAAILKRKK
jgi:hypothetical protein